MAQEKKDLQEQDKWTGKVDRYKPDDALIVRHKYINILLFFFIFTN